MVLSVYTLSEIYAGDSSSFSSALHYNTIIYTNIHYTALPLIALTCHNYTPPPLALPTPHPFILPPPTHTLLSSYIKMINVYLLSHSYYMCSGSDLNIDTR